MSRRVIDQGPSGHEFEILSGQCVKVFYCRLFDRYERILLLAERECVYAHRQALRYRLHLFARRNFCASQLRRRLAE